MKLRYKYDNGEVIEHTKFVNSKTMDKEKGEATQVMIYKVHTVYETEEREEYITTIILN